MPIDLGIQTIEKQIIRGTARFQSDPRNADGTVRLDPMTEFYRATIEIINGQSRMKMDEAPIQVKASDLEGLADYLEEIPPALQAITSSEEQLKLLFKLVPVIISAIGDAAELKENALQAIASELAKEV